MHGSLTIEGRRKEDECVVQVLAVLLERQAGVVGQLEVQIIATICKRSRQQLDDMGGGVLKRALKNKELLRTAHSIMSIKLVMDLSMSPKDCRNLARQCQSLMHL